MASMRANRARTPRLLRLAKASLLPLLVWLWCASCSDGAPPPLGSEGTATTMHPDATIDPCATPNDGCPCTTPGQVVQCGRVERNFGTYVDCSIGSRACADNGTWGSCLGNQIKKKSIVGGLHTLALGVNNLTCANLDGGVFGNVCDPNCMNYVDNPTGVDAGTGLTTEGGLLTLAPNSGLGASDAGTCKGLLCNIFSCPMGSPTRVTGKVFDPAGTLPVYNAIVYVPNMVSGSALTAFTPGVSCDTCDSLIKDPVLSSTLTAPDGSFTLSVPTGVNFDIVVQSGRWRRRVNAFNIPLLGACSATPISNGTLRFPRSQAEGDIPLIAIATGSGDALECLLYQMGIASSEFTAPSGTGRIRMYYQPTGAAPATVAGSLEADTNLWDSAVHIDQYNAVLMPCDNASPARPAKTATETQTMLAYLAKGGRLYTSHWSAHDWIEGATDPVTPPATATIYSPITWQDYDSPNFDYNKDRGPPNSGTTATDDIITQVNQSFQKGKDLATWIVGVGANAQPPAPATQGQAARPPPYPPGANLTYPLPNGYFSQYNWRHMVGAVNANATAWLTGDSRTTYSTQPSPTSGSTGVGPPGPVVQLLTFNTPVGAPVAQQCGRVVFPVMHVGQTSSGTFPGECPAPAFAPAASTLTPSEKVLEFMIFDATSCVQSDLVSPTPPMSAFPTDETFYRDFQAMCPPQTVPVWHVFDREDNMPLDSKIVFTVQNAATEMALGAAPSFALATDQGPLNQTATFYGTDVNPVLTAGGPVTQGTWLRVSMDLFPSSNGTQAPSITAWRQSYDCLASE
jgi:hypothetical protein